MKKNSHRPGLPVTGTIIVFSSLFILFACRKLEDLNPFLKHFSQVNLVDNNHEYAAANTDPKLINAWGIAFSPNGIAWVNSQGGHVSAVYNKDGGTLRPPVNIPSPGSLNGGNPTGIVFNGSADFVLGHGGPARFLFVGVDGILSGWNQDYGSTAGRLKNNSGTAAYTGLTIAQKDGQNYLYAADFRGGKITVWNKNFGPTAMPFKDPEIPAGYSPFNIQSVGEWLYVTYAKVNDKGEEEKGEGLGYVSIFETNGHFVKRFISKGALNAPWGVAMAPSSFFVGMDQDWQNGYSKAVTNHPKILIGNFGNGWINVYDEDGNLLGPLKSRGKPIVIEGLWAISFPPSTATEVDPNRLYFAAGPDDEKDGLFGYIIKQ